MPTLRRKSPRTSTRLVHWVRGRLYQHLPGPLSHLSQAVHHVYKAWSNLIRPLKFVSGRKSEPPRLHGEVKVVVSKVHILDSIAVDALMNTLFFKSFFAKIFIETPPSCSRTLSPGQTTSSGWRRTQQRYLKNERDSQIGSPEGRRGASGTSTARPQQ